MGIEGINNTGENLEKDNFDNLPDEERKKYLDAVFEENFKEQGSGDLDDLFNEMFSESDKKEISKSPESVKDINTFLKKIKGLVESDSLFKKIEQTVREGVENLNENILTLSTEISLEEANFVFSPESAKNILNTGEVTISKTTKSSQVREGSEDITITTQIWAKEEYSQENTDITIRQELNSEGETAEESISLGLEALMSVVKNFQTPARGMVKEDGNLEIETKVGFSVNKLQITVTKDGPDGKFKARIEAEIFT